MARYSVADQNVRVLKTQEEPGAVAHPNEKRKGYEPAMQARQVPRAGQYKTRDRRNRADAGRRPTRIIGKTLAEIRDSNIEHRAITAAMPSGTGLDFFKRRIRPLLRCRLSEEHAALFACGLATQGLKPFLAIYSTFFQRAYDMAIHDMAIRN